MPCHEERPFAVSPEANKYFSKESDEQAQRISMLSSYLCSLCEFMEKNNISIDECNDAFYILEWWKDHKVLDAYKDKTPVHERIFTLKHLIYFSLKLTRQAQDELIELLTGEKQCG